MEFDLFTIVFVLVVGFIGSAVGSVTGGVIIIVTSALIAFGLPAKEVIISCKLGLIAMMALSGHEFHKQKRIDYSIAIPAAVVSTLGAIVGSYLLAHIPATILDDWVGFVVLGMLALVVLSPDLGAVKAETTELSSPRKLLGLTLCLLTGFWGGFVGMGSLIFTSYVLMLVYKKSILDAAGILKLLAFAVNMVSVVVLLYYSEVNAELSILLSISMAAGGYWGTRYFLKKGERVARHLFIWVTATSALKYLLF